MSGYVVNIAFTVLAIFTVERWGRKPLLIVGSIGMAIAIAVAFQWIFNFIVSSTFIPMYNMKLGAMGENFGHVFTYVLYGLICLVAAWFVLKLIPETKGKTLEQMTGYWRTRRSKTK